MSETFGARMRQQRERQKIALTSIAEQTKISLSLLEGLERDDVVRWPAGIYRRSFVRSYAVAVGLDPDVVVREFLELYPDPAEAIEPAPTSASAEGESDRHAVPTRLRFLISRAIDAMPGHRLQRNVLDLGSRIELSTAAGGEPSAPAPAAANAPEHGPGTPRQPDLTAAARLCVELARVMDPRDVAHLLKGAADVLGAVGLIVWVWDPHHTTLRPALAHGYPDEVLCHLPNVGRDTDNATALAFRSGEAQIVHGSATATGAIVIPLMTPTGCGGVLAVEMPNGREGVESIRALATIFAAQLATLIGFAPVSKAASA